MVMHRARDEELNEVNIFFFLSLITIEPKIRIKGRNLHENGMDEIFQVIFLLDSF